MAKALTLAPQIKAVLNFTIRESMSPVQVLNQLLEHLGIECVCKWRTIEGKRVRTYSVDESTWQLTKAVIERRRVREKKVKGLRITPFFSSENMRGCAEEIIEVNKPVATQEIAMSSLTTASEEVIDIPQQMLLRLKDSYYDLNAWPMLLDTLPPQAFGYERSTSQFWIVPVPSFDLWAVQRQLPCYFGFYKNPK